MGHTDTVADMLTRIRNGVIATHETVEIPFSNLKAKIAGLLKKEGYITSYEIIGDKVQNKALKVVLKYGPRGEKLITGIERISKPGHRVYTRSNDAYRVLDGLGILIISTNKGLVTDRQARAQKVGGEILCKVW